MRPGVATGFPPASSPMTIIQARAIATHTEKGLGPWRIVAASAACRPVRRPFTTASIHPTRYDTISVPPPLRHGTATRRARTPPCLAPGAYHITRRIPCCIQAEHVPRQSIWKALGSHDGADRSVRAGWQERRPTSRPLRFLTCANSGGRVERTAYTARSTANRR